MGKDRKRRTNDEGSQPESVRTVRFPTNGTRRIECPICRGHKCVVCKGTGLYEIRGEVWADVQLPLVSQFMHDNLFTLSNMYSNMYGSTIKTQSLGMLKRDWEVWVFASLGGSIWFCINTKTAETRTFNNEGGLKKWLASGK